METQMASLSLGRCSLWLLLLGLLLPSASAQALSYREAVLRAVGQLNEKSSEVNLYRLLELDPPPKDAEDWGARKPASFRVKETVCPRTSQQPPEQCDFKENGLVKQCVGTVSLDPSNDQFDLNCNEFQSVRRLRPQHQHFPSERAKTMAKAIAITTAKARAKAMAKTTVIIIVKAKVKFSAVAKTNAKSTSIPADISHFKLTFALEQMVALGSLNPGSSFN
ncbi:cathelicidin-4-like [Budorcas taxicolor]|uniref:cathelicidin-4-like n=1 Tax=Budorcas taxicolor TaxID=37181 RepID=UPI0022845406|nr:cathelicidin-4-like [Budorcas taxicolor]